MKLESASMPPEDRKEISSNLKKAVKKAERIVSKVIELGYQEAPIDRSICKDIVI